MDVPAAAFTADPDAVYDYVDGFFAALVAAGVDHVVISPGSRSTPLAIGAQQTPGLRGWVSLDERSAAFFALGLGKATRRPAAVVCTSGTAAANYLPAIVEAYHARVPLIVLTADRPPELRDWGAGQTIEQPGLYGRYPRWTSEVPVPEAGEAALRHAARLAARAVEEAASTPAGAVHLNWPLREPLAPPTGRSSPPAHDSASAQGPGRLQFSRASSEATQADIAELAGLVRRHERGVICVGPMDPRADLATAIEGFARASGWPVLADPASGLRAAEIVADSPVLDMGDALLRAPDFCGRMRPTAVLRIGETPVSRSQRVWIEAARPEAVWWLDEGGQWGEPSQLATRVVRGGAASLLGAATQTLATLSGRSDGEWCRAFLSASAVARKVFENVTLCEEAWSGLTVAAAVARRMPAGSTLFASNSMAIRLLDLGLARRRDGPRILCNRGVNGIDGINSTALGVAAASDAPSVLLTGDLAFLHDLSGLLLARRERIPLSIVVIDDNGGGIFSQLPVARQTESDVFDRLFRTPHDVDLAHAAALFELDDQPVDDLASLDSALDRALAAPGVSIVRARLDPERNENDFRDCLSRLVAAVDDSLGGAAGEGHGGSAPAKAADWRRSRGGAGG